MKLNHWMPAFAGMTIFFTARSNIFSGRTSDFVNSTNTNSFAVMPAKAGISCNTLFFLLLLITSTPAIAANCSISTTPVAFGSYSPFDNAPLDSSGTISVNCSPNNTTYTVSLESGLQGSIKNRRMRGGSKNDKLNYDLYTDASRSIIWGNGSGNSQNVTKNTSQTLFVYGRIPAGQNGSVGSYSDSVTVIIDF